MKARKKTALITGSSRGIGLEIAKYLKHQGCSIILNGIDKQRLFQSKNNLQAEYCFNGDLSDPATISDLESYLVDVVGHLDFLVCNAGGGGTGGKDQNSFESWDLLIKKNLITTVNSVASCQKLMCKSISPAIVCISSIWLFSGF